MKMNNEKPIIQSNGYNGSEPTRICPRCNIEKPLSDFGFRNMGNGEIRNQSWCKECRSNGQVLRISDKLFVKFNGKRIVGRMILHNPKVFLFTKMR